MTRIIWPLFLAITCATAFAAPRSAATDIETVGIWMKPVPDYDGGMLLEPTPLVLFASGDALYDITALGDPAGLAEHKRRRPKSWTRWRRNGKRVEVLAGGRWSELAYQAFYEPLPKGHRLDGSYQRVTVSGHSGKGGSMVSAARTFTFDRDGRFVTGASTGFSSETAGGGARSGLVSGTYEIAGYTLVLRFDGRVERRTIIVDRDRPKAIWIDGAGYTR